MLKKSNEKRKKKKSTCVGNKVQKRILIVNQKCHKNYITDNGEKQNKTKRINLKGTLC